MSRNKLFLLFLIFIFIIIFIFILNTGKDRVLLIQEKLILFEITDQRVVGLDTATDAIRFGTIMRDNYAERKITIVNPYGHSVLVNISLSESVNNITTISGNDFILNGKDNMDVLMRVSPVNNTPLGNYTGFLKIVFYRVD